jgi:hypothetical protein
MLRNFDRRDLSRNKFWELFAYTKKILPDIFETRRIPDAWTPEYLKVVPIATRSWE